MKNFVLLLFVSLLALSARTSHAQGELLVLRSATIPTEQLKLFGEQNTFSSSIAVSTGRGKVQLDSLTYRIEGCSAQNPSGSALHSFTLRAFPLGVTSIGQEFQIDQARFVRFEIDSLLNDRSAHEYRVSAHVSAYSEASAFDRKCLRLTLERSGLETGAVLTGDFPLQGSALTLVRSKPTVTISTVGAGGVRARAKTDDVFRITVGASASWQILIKDLGLRFAGDALPPTGSLYEVIDDATGGVIGFGDLQKEKVVFLENNGMSVNPATTRSFRIRVNSSVFPNNSGPQSFSVQLPNPCDVQWDTENGNAGGPGLCLEPRVVPITTTVSYE